MDVVRSIGYVQLYFGMFLIFSGLLFVFALNNDLQDREMLNYDENYIPNEAAKFGITENSVEYKLLLDNYRIEYENNNLSWMISLAIDTVLMILFLLFGVSLLTEGISKTRMGKTHEVHPKQKLMNNLLLAGIFSLVTVFFIAMII